jgi:chaperone required for assembly of F1-ATPase
MILVLILFYFQKTLANIEVGLIRFGIAMDGRSIAAPLSSQLNLNSAFVAAVVTNIIVEIL